MRVSAPDAVEGVSLLVPHRVALRLRMLLPCLPLPDPCWAGTWAATLQRRKCMSSNALSRVTREPAEATPIQNRCAGKGRCLHASYMKDCFT